MTCLAGYIIVLALQDDDAWSTNPFELNEAEAAALEGHTDQPGNSLADIDAGLEEHACKHDQGDLAGPSRLHFMCLSQLFSTQLAALACWLLPCVNSITACIASRAMLL